jgi:hypothetical protein
MAGDKSVGTKGAEERKGREVKQKEDSGVGQKENCRCHAAVQILGWKTLVNRCCPESLTLPHSTSRVS